MSDPVPPILIRQGSSVKKTKWATAAEVAAASALVTPSLQGAMSPADKQKLNNLIDDNGNASVNGYVLALGFKIQPTGSAPTPSIIPQQYVHGSKWIICYLDGATARYKYLDLTGTGVTWVHSLTPP